MKIIYHNDLDGKCAANILFDAIRKLQNTCPEAFDDKPSKDDFIEADYSKKFDLSKVKEGERVAILDYHIEPEEMEKLIEKVGANRVAWIDHHKSSIEKYKKSDVDISGIRKLLDTSFCGAYLTYCWTEAWKTDDGKWKSAQKFVPQYLTLIDEWDTFKWHEKGNTDAYHHMLACNMYDLDPWDVEAWLSVKAHVSTNIQRGQIIAEYKQAYAKEIVKRTGFVTEIDGCKAYAANFPYCTSIDFEGIKEAKDCDIAIPFFQRGSDGKYTVSLYAQNPNVDCAKIAEKHGGGGHRGAAGFSCEELPFKRHFEK